MMNFNKEYNTDLNSDRKVDYRISTTDFCNWLNNHEKERKEFFKMVMTEEDDYRTAFDFSVYVIMIKWFRKTF